MTIALLEPLLLLAAAALLAVFALRSLRTGRVVCPPSLLEAHRDSSPWLFRTIVAALAVAALALAGLALSRIMS